MINTMHWTSLTKHKKSHENSCRSLQSVINETPSTQQVGWQFTH